MIYHSKCFTPGSYRDVSDAIEAFFVANPTFVPVSLSVFAAGENYSAILVYGV